jgi:hypothetical protein
MCAFSNRESPKDITEGILLEYQVEYFVGKYQSIRRQKFLPLFWEQECSSPFGEKKGEIWNAIFADKQKKLSTIGCKSAQWWQHWFFFVS